MGGMVQPDILGALDRLARLEPDLEMTGKVLGLGSEARDERVEQGLEVDRLQPGDLLARPAPSCRRTSASMALATASKTGELDSTCELLARAATMPYR